MKRRDFLKIGAVGAAGATLPGIIAACERDEATPDITWQMANSYPASLDTIYSGIQLFTDRVSLLTGGRFKITIHPPGELSAPTAVLDAVSARLTTETVRTLNRNLLQSGARPAAVAASWLDAQGPG